ncbi:hypothetical protein [Lentzea sp. NPDC059081]|uniref:hypothetical protein n=1 Tax=Lentzea sp. NPDC059081 TaxID=3346719 RepID=UPI003699382F
MTKTMIPDGPEPGDDRRFESLAGSLDVPFEPRLVASASTPALPKRPTGKHRTGTPAADLLGASLAVPTRADLQQVRATVGELHALVDAAMNLTMGETAQRLAASDAGVRAEQATLAARRVAAGHLNVAEREVLAGVLSAYSALPADAAMPTSLLATLEAAVAVLSASRADQELGAATDGQAAVVLGQDGDR